MSIYTISERIEMVTNYIRGMSTQEVIDNFAAAYPDRPIPGENTVRRLHQKFITSGCIDSSHVKREKRGNVATEDFRIDVCLAVEENPSSSLSQLANNFSVSRSTCYKVLKQEKFKSYKVRNVQQLLPDDYFRRMEFCEYWMERINRNPNITNSMLFTDESSFSTNGTVNKQTVRIWARKNPYVIDQTHTQWRESVNVWAGILGNKIIGPYFIDGTLTQEKYLELLQVQVGPALGERNDEIIFQHDGAPAHSAQMVTDYLNNTFPGNWIGRFGPFKWPARSPDISPLDFFYWGYLGSKVFDNIRERPASTEELRN